MNEVNEDLSCTKCECKYYLVLIPKSIEASRQRMGVIGDLIKAVAVRPPGPGVIKRG